MRNKNRFLFILLTLVLAFTLTLAACTNDNDGSEDSSPDDQASDTDSDVESLLGKRIALIMQLNIGTFSAQYVQGVEDQVEKFGGELVVFNANDDLAQMASHLDAAINQQFDAILIDHGTPEALNSGIHRALENNIPVIVFDALIDIPGVTTIEQGDALMAEYSLEKLAEDIGGEGNIVKIWVAGFAPMERRQVAYEAFLEKYPNINEIAAFGQASENTALETQTQMEAILTQYPEEGDIAAVWASWDEFAKGAVRAIQQAGRDEIKVYGIDLSDEDLQMIQDPKSPWVASAAVDPSDIGRIQTRLAYKKIFGEEVPDEYVLTPILVTRDMLPEERVTMEDLHLHVDGWGQSEDALEAWMIELEELAK